MFIYILTSHNIAERIKQCSHHHSNLNGYCDARVTQKFKWTWHWRKNQVIARALPRTAKRNSPSSATMKKCLHIKETIGFAT